mgnify:FL=1
MTTEKIKAHLTACGFEQQTQTRFHRKYIEVRVSEEGTVQVVTVSFYDPVADADLILYVDLSESEFIENALTD